MAIEAEDRWVTATRTRLARYGQLTVDGRMQLDPVAALDELAAAYGRTVLGVGMT